MRKKTGISIREVSQLSGVSVATVSRVINKTGNVSEETRNKVLKVMLDNDYVPDMVGKMLRTSVVNLIGIVVPDILVESFAEMIRHVQKTLQPMGIMTSICVTDNSSEAAQEYIDMLRSQRASGVIYIPEYNRKEPVRTGGLPIVYAFFEPPWELKKNDALIVPDREAGGYIATKWLLEQECRNIGIFYQKGWHNEAAFSGYVKAFEEAGKTIDPGNEVYTEALYTTQARAKTIELFENNSFKCCYEC